MRDRLESLLRIASPQDEASLRALLQELRRHVDDESHGLRFVKKSRKIHVSHREPEVERLGKILYEVTACGHNLTAILYEVTACGHNLTAARTKEVNKSFDELFMMFVEGHRIVKNARGEDRKISSHGQVCQHCRHWMRGWAFAKGLM